jgi:hypothetical protein
MTSKCRYCNRSFPTVKGRRIHEAKCPYNDGFGGLVTGTVHGR